MKNITKSVFTIIVFLIFVSSNAQNLYSELARPETDILNYIFKIEINDDNNILKGETSIEVKFTKSGQKNFSLDLVQKQADGNGMAVKEVLQNGKSVSFVHENNKINVSLTEAADTGKTQIFLIKYSGIPADGLIISLNKFGDRTFFGDNWPNRAHDWLPVEDHPSDKATCEFIITAPDHYMIISNGKLISEKTNGKLKTTDWKESVPIATKVMVFGAADFAVEKVNKNDSLEIQSWSYKKDSSKIFKLYHNADKIISYFQKNIGSYSYEKLANVQSKTRFGGMENAGCIFYNESADTEGEVGLDNLLSHEIAHQWFGNSITEKNWQHIWLSEGFATYFSALYIEHAYGKKAFDLIMNNKKTATFLFNSQLPDKIIIDSTEDDLMNLLNVNSYQKGAWVLHMLKNELDKDVFMNGVRQYYKMYRNGNASTLDFKNSMEKASGKNLDAFFQQWLYSSTIPELNTSWTYDLKTKKVKIKITQMQAGNPFALPLEIGFKNKDKKSLKIKKVECLKKDNEFIFDSEIKPEELLIDPFNKLLVKIKDVKHN